MYYFNNVCTVRKKWFVDECYCLFRSYPTHSLVAHCCQRIYLSLVTLIAAKAISRSILITIPAAHSAVTAQYFISIKATYLLEVFISSRKLLRTKHTEQILLVINLNQTMCYVGGGGGGVRKICVVLEKLFRSVYHTQRLFTFTLMCFYVPYYRKYTA